jgi:hypothetical protein
LAPLGDLIHGIPLPRLKKRYLMTDSVQECSRFVHFDLILVAVAG